MNLCNQSANNNSYIIGTKVIKFIYSAKFARQM